MKSEDSDRSVSDDRKNVMPGSSESGKMEEELQEAALQDAVINVWAETLQVCLAASRALVRLHAELKRPLS